jgi:hypothetical protein
MYVEKHQLFIFKRTKEKKNQCAQVFFVLFSEQDWEVYISVQNGNTKRNSKGHSRSWRKCDKRINIYSDKMLHLKIIKLEGKNKEVLHEQNGRLNWI